MKNYLLVNRALVAETCFKRFLTLFFTAFLALSAWGESVDFSAQGYTNGEGVTSYVGTAFSVSFASGSKYYDTGTAVRVYAGKTFTVSSNSSTNITGITLTFGTGDNFNTISTNVGTYSAGTWSGSATSITFTVGGTKEHRRIKGIEVTMDGGGSTPYTVTLSKNGSTSDITDCTGTYTLPTTGAHAADACTGWTWHCWANAAYAESTTAPSTTVITSMTSAGTAYAVYKHEETSGGGSTSTFVSADQGWGNGAAATTKTISGATYSFAQNGGSNAPKFYTSSNGVHLYPKNQFTINAGSSTISSIVFTLSRYDGWSANTGTWTSGTTTWTGSASSVTFTVPNTTGYQVRITSVVVTIGGGTTTTYTSAPPCTVYDITASSNNDSYGTVSVSGNTITANPADGYVADGYTLNSGTATISQSGNTYTVTPSSDCNITINFRAAATYTVTLIDNGGSTTETATEGVPYSLPADGLSSCDDATFLGWATGEYTGHLAGTSIEPTYDTPGASKTITGNTIFTAVYGVVTEGVSNEYSLISSAAELQTGDYLVVADYSSSHYAMGNSISYSIMDEESVSISSNKITTTKTNIIWRITKTGENYTLYNAAADKYLAVSSSNILLQSGAHNFTAAFSGSACVFESLTATGVSMAYDLWFESATSQSHPIKLYKRGSGVGTWTSKPQCCSAPGTPLGISSETTNFVGSGIATISLTGGNGESITWSCKDEGDHNCNSYLSGTSGAGDKTLTLPIETATKVYTVTVTQADNETDPDNVICGATVTLNFTVKAQFTINFKTVDGGSESLYNSITVTDGDTYEMPNIAEDYDCGTSGKSFMGWSSDNDATSVEKTAGTNVTATAAATWYACWSTSSDVAFVPLYEKVTSTSSLAAGDIVLICNTGATVAMGEQRDNNRDEASVTSYEEGGKEYVYFTGTDVHELTVGKDESNFTFYDGGYLYAASSSKNYLKSQSPNDANGKWALSIAADGAATVTAQGTNTRNLMRYNTTSHIFSCYSSGQQAVVFYKKTDKTKSVSTGSGSITTDMDGCTSGPTIRANTNQWITSAAGQTVKTIIDVTARNFETAATLSATSSNAHFTITLAATAVPVTPGSLATTLTVEYTPTESDITESSTITLKAGDVTKTITVNGRSLPEEFLLITKKTLWYALPGNMNEGPNEYAGVVVTPDDGTTPTMVGVAPSTVLYSLKAVTSDRYDDYGAYVRLAGFKGSCLWSNMAEGASTKINIQNKVNVATASGDNYEWLLTTTDGVQYTIANPHHPHYGAGRRLAYGAKFGLYTEPTIFYIVTAGCTSQPQEVNVGARRIDATFTWVSNTTDMHIDLYTNEGMTEGHIAATASSAPYVVTGLTETTDYWYKLTPGTDVACAVTGHFKTSGPIIDIVEWQENGVVLFIDKGDINPKIVIDGQEEHGSITGGGTATELFFAKYFEGAGDMKLLSIFNGTKESINLANYSIFVKCRNTSDAWSSSDDATLNLSSLGSIAAGQEIIFFTRQGGTDALVDCSDDFLDDKVTNCSKASDNPRWVECDGTTFHRIKFNGNDPIMLKKNSTIIDIIGSQGAAATTKNCLTADNEKGWAGTVRNMDKGKSPSDPVFDAFYAATSNAPVTTQDSIDLLDLFGINLEDDEIPLTTARCILFRDKRVLNGDSAVYMNETTGTTFVTFTNHDEFKSEWYGRSVCMTAADRTAAGVSSDAKPTCNSYQDIANMDYNKYYIDWHNIDPGKTLDKYSSDPETKEYTIPIADMRQYACLKLRFQLVNGSDVLTEAAQQVPIVVAANADTNDPLFSELVIDKVDENDPATWVPLYPQSVERCKTCDVVVLGGITLTKGSDSDPKDVDEIANLKIYPGGKLIVPSTTEYTVSSLAFRRQEDAVASANIQGTLNIGKTDGTYLDFRIDPTNWHYFSLPYNCNVADIRFSNEEEVAVPVLGTDFLLKKYNGEKRAATQAGGCWEMVAADETLRKGIGYIFALPGSGKVKREFRFPMSNNIITEEKDPAGKDVAGIYAYGGDKSMTEVRANHRGWNLLGNPYLLPYTSDIASPVMTGYIVEDHSTDPWDGHFMFADDARSNLRYIVEPQDNGWSEYVQKAIIDYSMKPFTCYFVQVGGADPSAEQGVTFHLGKVNRSSSPVRRAPEEYEEVEDTHPVWCAVDITNSKDEKDETTLLISNDFTDNYDMMNDLVKMRGDYYQYAQITTKPVLASRNNEGEMAFNALPDASAVAGVPLNFFAAYQGTYTISYNDKFDRDNEVKEVKLLDTKDNKWYDLMSEPYEFTSGRENNTERFILSVRVERKKPQTPTGLEDIGYSETPRKILINGHVYIQRGNALYDVTGKQLLNR